MSSNPPSSAQTEPRHDAMMWRRIVRFIFIFAVLLLLANALVCATLAHFFGWRDWVLWQVIPLAISLSFIPATILGRNHSGFLLRVFYSFAATWIGLLNYAVFAALACWVIDAITTFLAPGFSLPCIATVCFGLGLLATLAGLLNAAWIRVTPVTVALPNLPAAWANRSVALVTDIHLGHVSGPAFLRRIISRLRRIQPDIVLLGGDMFDGTTAGLDRLVAPWSSYSAPLGIYFVTGNHDEFADRRFYLAAVAKTGVRVLQNELVTIDGLQLLGIHNDEATDPVVLRNILKSMRIDRRSPSILLAHQPAHPRLVEEAGVSLQLSGHTHGGQFWPWNLIVRHIYGPLAYGLSRLNRLQVYTSSGIGTWGPSFRLGTRSEIVVFRFVSSDPTATTAV